MPSPGREPGSEPSERRFPAAVLFVDISGYTKLADRLGELGKLRGPEELCRMLDRFYEPLVTLLHGHGGDVVGFAGDAALAVWPAAGHDQLPSEVRRATHCALEILKHLNGLEVAPEVRLTMRITVGIGPLTATVVGGEQKFRQLIADGPPLEQIRRADAFARVGSVLLSPEARGGMAGAVELEPAPEGHAFVITMSDPPPVVPVERPDADALPEEALREYVPDVVRERIDAGQGEWLAELRPVTVLFLRVTGVEMPAPARTLAAVMAAIQRGMARYQGTVSQLISDDKGLVAVLAFGLPPFSHEDDGARAVWAAHEVRHLLRREGLDCGVGISTGLPYCGPLGGSARCVYTLVGRDVIRAARLMQAADRSILCDEETARAMRDRRTAGPVSLLPLPMFRLKGFREPVRVFRAVLTDGDRNGPGDTVGRAEESRRLRALLDESSTGRVRLVWVEGEAGLGKSHLIAEALADTATRSRQLGRAQPDPAGPADPWACVWADLLQVGAIADRRIRRERVLERFAARPEAVAMIEELLDLSGEAPGGEVASRRDAHSELLNEAIAEAVADNPVLIVLDRTDDFVGHDWHLVTRVLDSHPAVTVVLTVRPPDEPAPEYLACRGHPLLGRVVLGPLPDGAIDELARRRFGVAALGQSLSAHLLEAANGNPDRLFREANELLKSDRLTVENGVCELTDPGERRRRRDPSRRSKRRALIGREDELRRLRESVTAARAGQGRLVLIEGEAGVGKTRLADELRREADAQGVPTLSAVCASVERATPYHPWRRVVAELLGLGELREPSERTDAVRRFLTRHPSRPDFAALLNDFLGTDFPGSDVVDQLTGEPRADNFHDLVIGLIEAGSAGRSLVIVFDDAHWADLASWRLVGLARDQIPAVTLAICLRPYRPPIPGEYQRLLDSGRVERLTPGPLDERDTREMAISRFPAAQVSDAVASVIWQPSQGNPLFVEEVIHHLRTERLVEVRDGAVELLDGRSAAAETLLPDSVRGLVASRVDRLPLPHQLTAKISSVLGRAFELDPLRAIYPDPTAHDDLPRHLTALIEQGLVETTGPDPRYAFRHAVVRQVCYELLPRAQRRRIHHRAAEWFQSRGGAAPELSLIAHHWREAGFADRGAEYAERAGEAALIAGAYREAVDAYESLPRTGDGPRVAQREHQLGQAYFGLGDLPRAAEHLKRSLLAESWPVRTGLGLIPDALGQAARQLIRRVIPGLRARPRGDPKERSWAASAYARLAQIHYFGNEALPGIAATLRALNIAETAGRPPVLAHSYASMCIVTGLLRWHRAARVYARLAEVTARRIGHLPTICTTFVYSSMYHLGQGNWSRVTELAGQALATARRLGDRRQTAEAATVLAMLGCFRADYADAADHFRLVEDLARRAGNVVHTAWGLNGRGECLFRTGRIDESLELLQEAERLLHGKDDRTEEVRIQGLLAAAYLAAGERARALEHARNAERLIELASRTTCSTLEGFAGVAEVRLAALERDPDDPDLRDAARLAADALLKHARLYPIGRPRAALFRGRWRWLVGRRSAAVREWRRGLDRAERFQMPLEIALLTDALSRAGAD